MGVHVTILLSLSWNYIVQSVLHFSHVFKNSYLNCWFNMGSVSVVGNKRLHEISSNKLRHGQKSNCHENNIPTSQYSSVRVLSVLNLSKSKFCVALYLLRVCAQRFPPPETKETQSAPLTDRIKTHLDAISCLSKYALTMCLCIMRCHVQVYWSST
jgi:hypothetical protein